MLQNPLAVDSRVTPHGSGCHWGELWQWEIMKITSINERESNEFNLELNTKPKLNQAVFDHFGLHAARNPRLKGIAFSRPENSDLVLHMGASIDSVNSQGLASLGRHRQVYSSCEIL
jgi:hypothetical protein